jgi:hypothetical protein
MTDERRFAAQSEEESCNISVLPDASTQTKD